MPKRGHSTTTRYLDLVREKLALPSDYALAELLGVTTQAIYKMRAGGAMSVTTAARIAELLELDPLKVIAESELERGGDVDLWRRIARKVAVVTLGAIGLQAAVPPSSAEARGNETGAVYYVNSRRKKDRGFFLWRLIPALVSL